VCVSWFVLHWHFALVLVVMLVLGIIFFVFTFSGFGFWYFDVEFLLTFLRSRVVLALRCSALSCCLFGGWLSFFFCLVYLLWDDCFKNCVFGDGLILHLLVLFAELVPVYRYVGVQ